MQACEMGSGAVAVEPVESFGQLRTGRIAEAGYLRPGIGKPLDGKRGDDRDQRLCGHLKITRRWAGNGPAHCTLPTERRPRRTSAATSAGIWKPLTARPAQA